MGADIKVGTKGKSVILFDGVCNFCTASVIFIIKRDPAGKFKFASLQSEYANNILGSVEHAMDTLLLVEEGKLYKESTAALRIARDLKGGWKLLYAFIVIPKFLRDSVYRLIARNRYNWFGKKDQCMVPTPELRDRFLDS